MPLIDGNRFGCVRCDIRYINWNMHHFIGHVIAANGCVDGIQYALTTGILNDKPFTNLFHFVTADKILKLDETFTIHPLEVIKRLVKITAFR